MNEQNKALKNVEVQATALWRVERMVEYERFNYERAIQHAAKFCTHQQIADASTKAGRTMTRQRISQIIKDS